MPAALEVALDASASCEAPGKGFLVLFFKKEHPSFPSVRLTILRFTG
jgi:hypothetical protein